MSEGSVYRRKDGKWCAKYKGTDGTWKYLYRKTKTGAKQALREALRLRDEGTAPVGNKTVGALLDAWLQELEGTVSRRTWVNRECTMRVHLKPKLGNKRLSKLTPDDISGLYRSKLAEGLAPSYAKRLHIILKQALLAKYMSSVKPPKVPSKEMEVLTKEEVLHLLETVRGDRFECVYVLGALCGLRIGECLALRWEDIDLVRGTLTVRRTLWNGKTSQVKTPSSRRTLVAPERVLRALVRLRSTSDGKGTSLPPERVDQWQHLTFTFYLGADVFEKQGCRRP
jgi:integrase